MGCRGPRRNVGYRDIGRCDLGRNRMPTSPSTRLGLIAPADVGDAIKYLPDVLQAWVATLDPGTVVFDQGARTSRPPSTPGSPGVAGRFYQSTDDGGLDYDYGTGWITVAGPRSVVPILPPSPAYGQDILYLTPAMASVGYTQPWHLLFNGTDWTVLSAQPWMTETAGFGNIASGAYGVLGVSAGAIVLPLAGDYIVEHGCEAKVSSGTAGATDELRCSVSFAGAGATDADSAVAPAPASSAGAAQTISRRLRKNGLAVATTVEQRYRGSSGSYGASFGRRWLCVTPVRVS